GSWSGRNAIRLSNVRAIVQNNIIHIGNSEDYGNAIYSNTGSIVSIGNNIFVNRSGINTHPHADVLSTKDAFFVEDGSSYISLASNLFNTNPLFETGKYTLTSQSLAINAGVTLGNAGDGTAIRPLGYVSGAVDIGYAEYGYGGAVITYDEPPYITANPENQSGFAGGSATFTVSAESTDTLGYQWWKEPYVSELESKIVNSTKYSGATTNTLIINNLSTSDSTSTNGVSYVCEVYNTNDPSNLWQNSNSATLSVLENTGRVTSGVMSLYDFGETSGQTVSDSISPAINLTITGTVKQ
ncbi:MAG: immunoglobulin domain-containing protein, partial [Candidatus Riesia sp.]|nr:immunoglobulin domain-containing protein [Candidatus Riesia sp.]